jgi:hypothetical protein
LDRGYAESSSLLDPLLGFLELGLDRSGTCTGDDCKLIAGIVGAVVTRRPVNVGRSIGWTGRIGERWLKGLGGESKAFFPTTLGHRFVDQLVNRVAHESKVGYTTLTKEISRQIAKDAELIATRQIDGATWHFFKSPVTGKGTPSAPLREALERAGIDIETHP